MTWWGQFAAYALKLWEIWGDPTTGCLMVSMPARCLLIPRDSYPPQYTPELPESSLNKTVVMQCNTDQEYRNLLAYMYNLHWETHWQRMEVATEPEDFQSVLQQRCWRGHTSLRRQPQTRECIHRVWILCYFSLALIEDLKVFRFKTKEKNHHR